VVVLDAEKSTTERSRQGVVRIGVHRSGPLPAVGLENFDILLSAEQDAPAPWVAPGAEQLETSIAALRIAIERQPVAASVVAQVLCLSPQISFEHALLLESLGYSMLLASTGFRSWRAATPVRERGADEGARVLSSLDGTQLSIRLSRPAARNAFDARMRDELVEALEFARDRADITTIELSGEGLAFSAGGDLDEFGSTADVGVAHLIRTLRSPAYLVHALGDRAHARLHGACIGAGIEIPAAAARVTARANAVFRLPEVSMGLIPGAGGTASIPRRIGRHRACYMAISGVTIDLQTALAWRLVDNVDASP
jgi:Enoyl-CoA hydratase/isomerase